MSDERTDPTRIRYGPGEERFGDLYVPGGAGPHSVVVLIHGGFWREQFRLDLMAPLAEDLVERGFAVWNIEYHRVGQPEGGYPGTLLDVAAAFDELAQLAPSHDLDVGRVGVVGHSAGGHLALWVAGRGALPDGSPGAAPEVTPAVAVGQAPVAQLRKGAGEELGRGAVIDFLGGQPSTVPERYDIAEPRPTRVPVVVVTGDEDTIVPMEFSEFEGAEVVVIEGADHFDVIDPTHAAWAAVIEALSPLRR